MATQYQNAPYYLQDFQTSIVMGTVTWAGYNPGAYPRYTWALDSDSNLYLALKINGYPYTYYPYVSATGTGSALAVVAQAATVKNFVNSGNSAYLKGCVNPLTGKLTVTAGGRTQMMNCGAQLWMSNNLGVDVNRGGCTQMFPTIQPTISP